MIMVYRHARPKTLTWVKQQDSGTKQKTNNSSSNSRKIFENTFFRHHPGNLQDALPQVLQAPEYQKIAENREKGMTPVEGLIRMLIPQPEMATGLFNRKIVELKPGCSDGGQIICFRHSGRGCWKYLDSKWIFSLSVISKSPM
jgi:hypothetical protein